MKLNVRKLVLKSLLYYRKAAFNQAAIIMILTAVVTGSLLTGYSVRESLRISAGKRLGNTGLVISSGMRYFSSNIDSKLSAANGTSVASVLETEGTVEKFGNDGQQESVKIYGVKHTFFQLHNIQNKFIDNLNVAINENLARRLNLSAGDEIILSHRQISDLPSSTPFSPSAGNIMTHVFKIKYILTGEEAGNFSLEINQTTPVNIFVNINELSKTSKANRMLIHFNNTYKGEELLEKLKSILTPFDAGLKVRFNKETGTNDILTERIFFDASMIEEIKKIIPSASPVITYLINSTEKNGKISPYSFASAVDRWVYQEVPSGNNIIINKWLAEDIGASSGDTLLLRWYNPERISCLEENEGRFVVSGIVEIDGKWDDHDLMPEFPGISGRQSCSRWDTGIPLKSELIRKKDEDYWNIHKGTPKIFLDYQTGERIWASNFGSATSLRVPGSLSSNEIINSLTGSIEPAKYGFTVNNIRNEMINAANQSVDFRLLFLGLGFFIIASCFILLIMAVNSFLDSRRSQIYMLFTFGFSDRKINFLLFTENIIISFTGSLAGVFAGIIFNEFLINALNGVWKGAVHTDTIIAVSGINPLLTGFFSAFFAALFLQLIRIKKYLREMHSGKCREFRIPVSRDKIIKFLTIFFIAFGILLTVLNLIFLKEQSLSVSYSSGACLYTGLILLWRLFLIRKASVREEMNTVSFLSRNYYTFYPGRAIMPVLLISAGLFTVTVTGVNRLQVTESSMSVRGGTGGFLLWAETAVPIKENLNLPAGKKVHGLSYHPAETIFYLQAKKLHGDDASCLNLNYITSPSLLGLNPSLLSDRKAFSFATLIKGADPSDPWSMLKKSPAVNTIYGFADQTVLQWGLKKSVGDTLIYRSETGEQLNIIIAGGLKSSVFQGYVITSEDYFSKYFPSVPGYSVFLAGGILELTDDYVKILNARFNNYGIKIMSTKERLERFFEVTNTYLSVFMILGGLGVILGVAGLAFVLRQNYNFRKRDFALMMALGFEEKKIRKIVFSEQVIVLFAGIITGITASLSATFPSIEKGTEIPVRSIALIILAIAITGIATLYFAVRGIKKDYLIHFLRRE